MRLHWVPEQEKAFTKIAAKMQNGLNATAENGLMLKFLVFNHLTNIFEISDAGKQNFQKHIQQMANYTIKLANLSIYSEILIQL